MPKLFEVIWAAYGDKCIHVEPVEAVTKTQATGIIRWRELKNGIEIKDITAKEIKEVA